MTVFIFHRRSSDGPPQTFEIFIEVLERLQRKFRQFGEELMRPTRTLAAALIAASIPLYTGSATAAPLSQPQALKSADVSSMEQAQYRRWDRGRWIGPAAGFAGAVAAGSALAAAPGAYYAYGAAPGAAYAAAIPSTVYGPGYRGPQWYWGYGAEAPTPGSSAICTWDRDDNSAHASWLCR
jgi:hypothetical protein